MLLKCLFDCMDHNRIDDRHRVSVGETRLSMAEFFQQYICARFPDKIGRMEFSYSVSILSSDSLYLTCAVNVQIQNECPFEFNSSHL